MMKPKLNRGRVWLGIVLGIAYGIITRLVIGQQATLASLTYLFIIPTILGVIPLVVAYNETPKSYANNIFVCWLTVAAFLLSMYFFGIEDFISSLVLAVPFFLLATVVAMSVKTLQFARNKRNGILLALMLLPFLFAVIENNVRTPTDTYNVKSTVTINATSEKIWNNIVEVHTIDSQEYKAGFFNSIGIPRPISASVNKKELGGKRIGNFEGGLTFLETITVYEEQKKISFDINIDPTTVGHNPFYQNVLHSKYFKFLDATYELTELESGEFQLTLNSSYQLSSTINFYGKYWGDMILSDFQDRLLYVIETRCEDK